MKKSGFLNCALAVALASSLSAATSMAQTSPPPNVTSSTFSKLDPKPIENLLTAAQRLRDATHEMVRAPATQKRAELIDKTDKTLLDVQTAMANLPPDLLTANASETAYQSAADRLQQAADHLHDAVKALSSDPSSEHRNETMKRIKESLAEVQQLMLEIPRAAPGHKE